jgi:hypothetical protein
LTQIADAFTFLFMRILLVGCCVAGIVIPYAFALPFFLAHGLNLRLLIEQAFANRVAAFFTADLVLSSVMFLAWSRRDAAAHKIPNWWFVLVANFIVGLSLAFPLYLLKRLDTAAGENASLAPAAHIMD